MPFDAVLPNAGSDGRYQHLLLWLVLLPAQLPFGSHGYCQLLMSWTPDHWCRVSEVDAATNVNSSMFLYAKLRLYLAREYRDWELLHSQCRINRTIYAQALYQEAGISVKWNSSKEFECSVDGWYYNKSREGSELESIVSNWDLVCDRSWIPTFTLVLFGIGEFLSMPLYFYVTYRHGLRFSFFLFTACECLFGSATAMSPNVGCFGILRFLLGLTVPASIATPATLAQELFGPQWRGRNIHLIYLYRSLGGVLLSATVFVVRDWSHIALASTVPLTAFFLYWCAIIQQLVRVLPESPQWLLARGRFEETMRLVRTIATVNGSQLTPDYIVATKRKFILERSLSEHREEPKTQREATKNLFKAHGFRKRIIVIMFSWVTSTASFLGLNYLCIELQGDVHLNLLLSALTEVLGWAIAALILRCISRRCSYCVTCALGGVLCVTMAARRRGKSSSITLFVSTKLSVSISYFVLPLWMAELLPTGLREPAIVLAEILSLACPVFLPLLIYQGRSVHSLPMTLIGVLQILGGLVALSLPETRLVNFLNQQPVVPLSQCSETWTEHNCSKCHSTPKCSPRNCVRDVNLIPESPIFSLLRRQENQVTYSGRESSMSNFSGHKTIERHLSMDELKVTVL